MKSSLAFILICFLFVELGCVTTMKDRHVAQSTNQAAGDVLLEDSLMLYKEGLYILIQSCEATSENPKDKLCKIKPDTTQSVVPITEFTRRIKLLLNLRDLKNFSEMTARIADFGFRYADNETTIDLINKLKNLKNTSEINEQVSLYVDQTFYKNLKKYVISSDRHFFESENLVDLIENPRLYATFVQAGSNEIQQTVVTQIQYFMIMKKNPSGFKSQSYCKDDFLTVGGVFLCPKHPVENVSWNEAKIFIAKLNDLDSDYSYRLPTESELEMAIRAGTKTTYWFGDDEGKLKQYAWYQDNSGYQTRATGTCPSKEIDCKNPWGLFDAHGNVWQWVDDSYGTSSRLMRGGSWNYNSRALRSESRFFNDPDGHMNDVGFRLIRVRK